VRGVVASAVLSDSFTSYRGTNGTLAWGIEPTAGHIGYVLRSGVQPVGANEMVIGPQTAKQFHFHVGDTVPVDDTSGGRSPVRIVGIALFPALDSGTFNDSIGFSAAGFARHVEPDSVTRRVVVKVGSKGEAAAVEPQLARIVGNGMAATSPIRPGDVDNLASLRRFPLVLALFTALLGFAAIAHVVLTTTRRRRHDLATLRSLGLTPRQAQGCLVWQALTIAAAAVVIGVPLGVLAGSRVWQAATRSLGTATDPARALVMLGMVAAGALLVAAAIAAPAGWRATRARPASALHTE
jgi:ABC-type lipoprotein release transport system permease subunit